MRQHCYRVLLCGTNYGRVYLEPIEKHPRCELVGILACGSKRSQALARDYGVPLYSTALDLPAEIDIACAAMGSPAFDVVVHLLRRGIHVLCEHPLKSKHLRAAQRACSAGTCFHVNGHFGALTAPTAFITECQKNQEKPVFMHVTLTDRILYGLLDTLCLALGAMQPLQLNTTAELPDFAVVSGRLAGIQTVFQIQRAPGSERRVLADGSRRYLVDFSITLTFPTGNLHLSALPGPVLWTQNLYRSPTQHERLWRVIYADERRTWGDFKKERFLANYRAIDSLILDIESEEAPPEQDPNHLREVVAAWEALSRTLALAENAAQT